MSILHVSVVYAFKSQMFFSVNHVDIGPPHGSIILGISNTFGTLGGILSPILTGAITTHQSLQEWQAVFYVVIGVYVVGMIFFDIFGSGEAQPWVYTNEEAANKENKTT